MFPISNVPMFTQNCQSILKPDFSPAVVRQVCLAKSNRRGFTLMELLLVLAIIVLLGALSTPSFIQTFSRQSLEKGADRVRIAMGQARVKAIRSGDIYAVYILEGGAWFNVAPFSQAQAQTAIANQRQQLAGFRMQSDFEDDLLPKGVTFVGSQTAVDSRAAEMLSGNESGGLRPILFYPDGTSQDARVVLQNDKGVFVEIQLRGLTGLSSLIRLDQPPGLR